MLDYWQDYPEIQEQLKKVQALMLSRLKINSAEISAAVQNFASNGGKMVRPALFLLLADLVKPGAAQNNEKFVKIAASLELLHSATLIHDDIIDDSPLRRGLPSVESQFGKDIAVYTGDFIYTVYFELLVESMAETPFLAYNAKSMKKILQGELTQMGSTFDSSVSIRRYLKAIAGKTAELLSLACVQGVYFAGGDKQLQRSAKKIGLAVGLAFQIYDDLLNFTVGLDEENKPILTDVRQGIYTLPLLIAKENAPEEILPFLESPENLSREACLKLADAVSDNAGLSTSLLFAQSLTDKALSEIEKFPASKKREELSQAVKALLQRNY